MTLDEAIKRLQKLAKLHGGETDVFFDCPHCDNSFAPNTVVKKAVHLTADPKEPK